MIEPFDRDFAFGAKDPKICVLLDRVYKTLFPIKEIRRFASMALQPNDTKYLLDRELHIDVLLITTDEIPITIQEKVRRENYLNFNDFTLEYHSNIETKVKGEYFNLHADYYSYAWVNNQRTKILRHYVFNIPTFKRAFSNGFFDGKYEAQINDWHSKASFIAIPFNLFPKDWFIYIEC